jgi:hypothetical protein
MCPPVDRPAGQRENLQHDTKEGVRMTGPVFPAGVARFSCASDSLLMGVVDGCAFSWWQVACPEDRGLWS